MRITIASSGLGHVARGIEAWAADLGRALAERGEAVTVCKGGGRAEEPYERVIPCWQRAAGRTGRLLHWLPRRFTWRLGLGSGYAVEQTTFALNLLQHLRREQVHILHVGDPYVAFLAERARRIGLIRTRTILAHATEEPLDTLRHVTYLQQIAPWHLETTRQAGVWKATWTAIPYFIHTDQFSPGHAESLRDELGIPQDALVILCAAAIRRQHKRIDYLLSEVARLICERPCLPTWLVVAGGWESDTDELVEEGKRLLGNRVRFLIRFPRTRMPELYRAADIFVLPSLFEMFGLVLLEAAASGLPCLVHSHPVLQWVLGPGGEAITMAEPGTLAAALQNWLADPVRRRHAASQARRHCIEHFSKDRVVDQILDYYRFVLNHDRPKRAERATSRDLEACPSS